MFSSRSARSDRTATAAEMAADKAADQGAEKHDGAGTSGITDQEKELSSSALQAFSGWKL